MAIFTTADRDAIKAAMVTLASEGIATVTIAGQTVTARSLDELRRMLEMVQADLSSGVDSLGLTFRKLVPPGCG